MYSRILVSLDGSNAAEQALPYARFLAESLRLPVELLAVIDSSGFGVLGSTNRSGFLSTMLEREIGQSRNYLETISRTFSGLSVKCAVKKGNPSEVIIDEAAVDKNTLITMATHGRSGLGRWLLGSVAEKVLRGSTNDVLLVRANKIAESRGSATLQTVIVPLDGSELAESILPSVLTLTKALKLGVVLIRAFRVPASMYAGGEGYYAIDVEQVRREFQAEAFAYLQEKGDELKGLGIDEVSMVAPEGFGADEIIDLGQKTPGPLIVMCTHGRSGITRWAMGSVTETVVRHAGVPVLVRRTL
jgi:nucleotide-binding universal stress UspA family protein